MTEQLRPPDSPENDLQKARDFYNLHVREYSSEEFAEYRQRQFDQWVEKAHAAIDADEPVYPMWTRRNEGGGTFWGACVDYIMPIQGGPRIYASIVILNDGGGPTTIEVWLPKRDGSGEPVSEFKEIYRLETLDQAIEFAEAAVPPRKLRRSK